MGGWIPTACVNKSHACQSQTHQTGNYPHILENKKDIDISGWLISIIINKPAGEVEKQEQDYGKKLNAHDWEYQRPLWLG